MAVGDELEDPTVVSVPDSGEVVVVVVVVTVASTMTTLLSSRCPLRQRRSGDLQRSGDLHRRRSGDVLLPGARRPRFVDHCRNDILRATKATADSSSCCCCSCCSCSCADGVCDGCSMAENAVSLLSPCGCCDPWLLPGVARLKFSALLLPQFQNARA